MTNSAAFGVGVAVGFCLSLARLALWTSLLRPKTSRTKAGVMLVTILVIPAVVALAMPTFVAGLLVWFGAAVGAGVSTPVVLPLAHLLFGRQRRRS